MTLPLHSSIQFGNTYHLLMDKQALSSLSSEKRESLEMGESYYQDDLVPELTQSDGEFSLDLDLFENRVRDVHVDLSARGDLFDLRLETSHPVEERVIDRRLMLSLLKKLGLDDVFKQTKAKWSSIDLNQSEETIDLTGNDISEEALNEPLGAVFEALQNHDVDKLKSSLLMFNQAPENQDKLLAAFLRSLNRASTTKEIDAWLDWGMPLKVNNDAQLNLSRGYGGYYVHDFTNSDLPFEVALINRLEPSISSYSEPPNYAATIHALKQSNFDINSSLGVQVISLLMFNFNDVLVEGFFEHFTPRPDTLTECVNFALNHAWPTIKENDYQIEKIKKAVKYYVEKGADLSVTDENNQTPLDLYKKMYSKNRRQLRSIKKLLKPPKTKGRITSTFAEVGNKVSKAMPYADVNWPPVDSQTPVKKYDTVSVDMDEVRRRVIERANSRPNLYGPDKKSDDDISMWDSWVM